MKNTIILALLFITFQCKAQSGNFTYTPYQGDGMIYGNPCKDFIQEYASYTIHRSNAQVFMDSIKENCTEYYQHLSHIGDSLTDIENSQTDYLTAHVLKMTSAQIEHQKEKITYSS